MLKLYQFRPQAKALTAVICIFGTISAFILTLSPVVDIGIPPLVLLFCIIVFDLASLFVVFYSYICLNLREKTFISKSCGATQLKIDLSQIERLQMNYNPDSDRFLIEILQRDGTVKTVNWDQNFRSHAYKKQKDRCTAFIEQCNSAIHRLRPSPPRH